MLVEKRPLANASEDCRINLPYFLFTCGLYTLSLAVCDSSAGGAFLPWRQKAPQALPGQKLDFNLSTPTIPQRYKMSKVDPATSKFWLRGKA